MLIINIKNNTKSNYDAIRRAAKAAYKNSSAYRQRQVMFDDSHKADNVLTIKIGDPQTIDLVFNTELTSVNQLTQNVVPFDDYDNKGVLVAAADPEDACGIPSDQDVVQTTIE